METLEPRERISEKFLIPFFKEQDIREIRRIHIDEFHKHLKGLGISDKYIYNIIGELRARLRFPGESLTQLPTFSKISFQGKPINWLTRGRQEQVFVFIPQSDRPIFDFMRHTACRPNEARGRLKENVHRDQGYFVLATVLNANGRLKGNTKTKKIKPLPIIPELQDALKPAMLEDLSLLREDSHTPKEPWSGSGIRPAKRQTRNMGHP